MWWIALCAQSTSTWFVSFRSQPVRNINLEMYIWPRWMWCLCAPPTRAGDISLFLSQFTHSYRIFIAEMKKGHLHKILCRCWVNECFGFLFHHYYRRHHHHNMLLLLLILFVSLSNYPSFRNIFAALYTYICCLLVCLSQMNSEWERERVCADQPNTYGAIFIFGNVSSKTVTIFRICTVLK